MGKRQKSKDKRARAKRLKEEANALFTKKDFKAASSKYTEAIALDVEDIKFAAVLYCNRAACHLSRMKYDEAATDAIKATSLDPLYARAWARLAAAKEKLKLPLESTVAWKKAVLALRKDDINEEEGKQRAQYEENLAIGLEATPIKFVSSMSCWEQHELLESHDQHPPWTSVADGTDSPKSSAWMIGDASRRWCHFNGLMDSLDPENLHKTAQLDSLYSFSTSILIDPRAFYYFLSTAIRKDPRGALHFPDLKVWIVRLMMQIRFEIDARNGWHHGTMSEKYGLISEKIITEAKARDAKEGFAKVGATLSSTIHSYVSFAFASAALVGDRRTALQLLICTLDVIRQGQRIWPQMVAQGFIVFQPWFHTSVKKMYLDVLVETIKAETDAIRREQYLQAIHDESRSTIKLIDGDLAFTSGDGHDLDSAARYYIQTRDRGHAYAIEAFVFERQAQLSIDPSKILELSQRAAASYLDAAKDFPEDDEWHVVYLNAAIKNMLEGGAPVGTIIRAMQQLRLKIPKARKIWGSWMDFTRPKAFEFALRYERKLRELLAEGVVDETHAMCTNFYAASAFGLGSFVVKFP
ncbi:hypothetical protein V5O48_007786 [Marasmius crinis-equi]|uniref:TPR-like protein n=1 Tax=Marasmius crinis-equi TaxID=585013 RepID=A0ABR3FFQ3_9AGAR